MNNALLSVEQQSHSTGLQHHRARLATTAFQMETSSKASIWRLATILRLQIFQRLQIYTQLARIDLRRDSYEPQACLCARHLQLGERRKEGYFLAD
jgi:hypothetical protein